MFAKAMTKFEDETNNFFDTMRNLLKAVFVKQRFSIRVLFVKNGGTERFCSI